MDIFESPTQSNDGRSYDQYQHDQDKPGIASSPKALESQNFRALASHETQDGSLHEDETGAVKFEWHSPPDNIMDTQAVDGCLDEDGDEVEIMRPMPSPPAPPHARHSFVAMAAPETPAVASRLFQNGRDGGELMAASQLFNQTQFTSGVKKAASPTSSRPSPDVFNHNTISPNVFPSHEYGLRTSPGLPTSPALPPDFTTSPAFPLATPSKPMLQAAVPESYNGRAKKKPRPDPINQYVSIRSSSATPAHESLPNEDSESDRDENQQRRLLAKLKQGQALKSLTSISIPRQISKDKDEIEVPSTRRSDDLTLSATDKYVEQCSRKVDATDKDESQETVADSQEPNPLSNTYPTSHLATGTTIDTEERAMAQPELPLESSGHITVDHTSGSTEPSRSKETIPETSPARTVGILKITNQEHFQGGNSCIVSPSLKTQQITSGSSSPVLAARSSPPIFAADSQSSQTSRRSRGLRQAAPLIQSSSPRGAPPTSSTLSPLSATPNISSSTTPNTDTGDAHGIVPMSSPAKSKVYRQAKPTSKPTVKSPAKLPRNQVTARRLTRQSSVSTDELARSSPDPKMPPEERSRTSRSFARKSTEFRDDPSASIRRSGIFQGMTFAITFQSGSKLERFERKSTELKILQAGGSIVTEFDELFDGNSIELKTRANMGFTALITDVHSRKVKYLQALALGLPCLSWKWVSHSVSANKLIDWSPYVLCAGESRVLGTTLSRSLQSYDAENAQLRIIVEQRPKLFKESKILLVMKRTRNEATRMRYVFLARLLGAAVDRVATVDEARAKLREKENTEDSYDWVYTEGDTEASLFGQTSQAQTTHRKRKRESTAGTLVEERRPQRIRTLTDELVVQTLIFGRLIREDEESEMNLD